MGEAERGAKAMTEKFVPQADLEQRVTAIGEALGTACFSRARDFPMTSMVIDEFPVTLAPGRARLATSPAPTGSPTLTITIGIVLVAFLAANDACVTTETIASTLSWTNSAASCGSRSNLPSANR